VLAKGAQLPWTSPEPLWPCSKALPRSAAPKCCGWRQEGTSRRLQGDSLVQLLIAGLAHAHLLLDAKLGDGGVLRGALAAEDLPACPAVML
jgi:hypothetical protein